MNLKNLFIPLLAVATMVSCSKDDDLGPQEPDMTPDCWFTLAVDTDTQTKTRAGEEIEKPETDPTLPRNIISDLAVFVYIGGEYHASGDTTLVDAQKVDPNIKTLSTVNRIPVKSGNVKVLVVANAGSHGSNADKISEMKGKKLEEALKIMLLLDREQHKHLSMSSEVFSVTLQASKNNYVGYNGSFGGDVNGVDVPGATTPINLYRNVARIQLSKLTLADKSDYGKPVKFVLDTMFIANAKGASYLCPTNEAAWGPVEYPMDSSNEQYWWFGACNGTAFGDSLTKVKKGYENSILCIPFNETREHDNYYDGTKYMVSPIVLDQQNPEYEVTVNNVIQPIGNFFYVYENMKSGPGYQTLLVLKGDYTYTIPGTTKDTTVYNRFYPVIVNDKGKGTGFEGVAVHEYVKRNTQYSINLTISGSGSDKPYDPAARAYVGGTVKVLNWGVIEVKQSAD